MTDDESDVDLLPALLDGCIGDGPSGLPTPTQRLSRGRRALRRRRLTAVAAGSAAVLVVGGLGSALLGQGSVHDAEDPTPTAGDAVVAPTSVAPSANSPSGQDTEGADSQQFVSDQFPAAYDPDGDLVIKEGWTVTRRLANPLGLEPPQESQGLVVTKGQRTRWMLVDLSYGVDEDGERGTDLGAGAAADDPGKAYRSFDDWLADQVAINGGPAVAPLVTIDDSDTVRPGDGVDLLETRALPPIAGYSSPGDRAVEVRRDGHLWFAIVRGHRGDADVIPVDADVLTAPTFAALLTYVRDQANSGEGLR